MFCATPACAHVLLETVAQTVQEGTPSASAGHEQTPYDPHGAQLHELLAPVEDTLAIQTRMINEWLRSQGLIGVCDLWMKAHGYA